MSEKMREALLKCKTCALPTEVRDLVIAALAEQPAQGDPVAWVNAKALKLWTESGSSAALAVRLKNQNQKDFIPLYTAPPAPSVPDEQKLMRDSGPADAGFVRGWNACRAAMRAAAPEPRS